MAAFNTDEVIEFVTIMEESMKVIQLEDEQGSSSVDMLLHQCEDILEVVVLEMLLSRQ